MINPSAQGSCFSLPKNGRRNLAIVDDGLDDAHIPAFELKVIGPKGVKSSTGIKGR
jgi:hypothetical protein